MTRERAKELLPVIQAFAEGRDIEECYLCEPPKWIKSTNPEFDNDNYKFRIKPEPRRFWLSSNQSGLWHCFTRKEMAMGYLRSVGEAIEVVEVIKEGGE